MLRKTLPILSLGLLIATRALAEDVGTPSEPAQRPNVIVFYTDDQGSLDANCYGSLDLKQDIGETENLAAKHADIATQLHAIHSRYQADIEAK